MIVLAGPAGFPLLQRFIERAERLPTSGEGMGSFLVFMGWLALVGMAAALLYGIASMIVAINKKDR